MTRERTSYKRDCSTLFCVTLGSITVSVKKACPFLKYCGIVRSAGQAAHTGRMWWMAHRKWKEAKQLPGTAGPGNMLGCCLIYFHFLWAIHPIRHVDLRTGVQKKRRTGVSEKDDDDGCMERAARGMSHKILRLNEPYISREYYVFKKPQR